MNDRPSAEELLAAVQRFLEEDVVPALDGPRRFHARVAANVVGIVAREIARGDSDLRAEWAGLAALLGREDRVPADSEALSTAVRDGTSELVERIRAGEADAGPFRDAVIAHLEQTVAAKLAVAERPKKGT